ncbi:MAG TPA: hypothetical protein VK211_12130, partial [Kamptonema sp.]|nr:hypothetical protein [Kamptonema sp.]
MTDNRSALTQWAGAALGLPEVQVQVRLRGNHLHILCEAAECPSQDIVVAKYSAALGVSDLEKLLSRNQPRIYQVFLCGRRLGARQNDWAVRLSVHSPKSSDVQPLASHPPHSPTEVKGTGKPDKSKQEREISRSRPTIDPIAPPSEVKIRVENSPIIAHSQETEYEASPLTIDTASNSRLSVASVPLHSSSYPMTAGQITQQSTATLEVPPQESNSTSGEGTLTISCERLARRGYPDAIASYLSEILGSLGVSVKVSIREGETGRLGAGESGSGGEGETAVSASVPLVRRLLVLCESGYSPDPSLLAEPIAGRLRDLKLENFRDAVICSQVRGEAKPEWMLRVDLTPQSLMLKEWARWGDVGAIARLLNQELAAFGIEVRATLKEFTLHLFCNQLVGAIANGENFPESNSQAPDKQTALDAIAPILAAIAPQGIRAATVYGTVAPQSAGEETPVWIGWLDLPAAHHPDLAASATTLAAQGDRSALTFLINRLLNPNLDRKLQTGGIRALILPKGDLLHIMSEAPTCPSQSKVGPPIAQFLRQLQIPGIVGVRVYGRRAGQKLPLWRYGVEVSAPVRPKSAVVPANSLSKIPKPSFEKDIAPEFAPSAADMAFTGLDGDLVLLPDFAGEALTADAGLRRSPRRLGNGLLRLQRSLIGSGLFVPNDALSTNVAGAASGWRDRRAVHALVWATAGCLLAFQVDSQLGKLLEPVGKNDTTTPQSCQTSGCQKTGIHRDGDTQGQVSFPIPSPNPPLSQSPQTREVSLPQLPLQPSASTESREVFNGSGFTKPGTTRVAIAPAPTNFSKPEGVRTYPTFKSDQLDEQLVRYQQYIRTHKRLPDIMIVGSSRALRGVEPIVLEKALAEQGYPGLKVYNFGVNGATVQVVDLILRQVLPVEELPKLILFADGARAVNSGRLDVTYNAIAASVGYRQLAQGTFQIHTDKILEPTSASATPSPLSPVAELMHNIDNKGASVEQFLNQTLSHVSGTYRNRDRLKGFLQSLVMSPQPNVRSANQEQRIVEEKPTVSSKNKSEFESNGFLPIALRFDPATYYQQYSKVSGDYDADYQSFQLTGRQTDALKNLHEFTKAHNINLVFVNMPLTKDYLDPVRAEYEEEFRQQ